MASNKANSDWWTETPKDLILHDQIWYNAIRALVSVESRLDSRIADAALDRLIREGLIDQDEKEVSLAMQQWLRYPAILADRLANSQGVLSKEVIGYLEFVVLVLTNCSFPPSGRRVKRRWRLASNIFRDLTSPFATWLIRTRIATVGSIRGRRRLRN